MYTRKEQTCITLVLGLLWTEQNIIRSLHLSTKSFRVSSICLIFLRSGHAILFRVVSDVTVYDIITSSSIVIVLLVLCYGTIQIVLSLLSYGRLYLRQYTWSLRWIPSHFYDMIAYVNKRFCAMCANVIGYVSLQFYWRV